MRNFIRPCCRPQNSAHCPQYTPGSFVENVMWFVRPGTTSCFPNSRGAQKEWITMWSGMPSVVWAPPPSEARDRSTWRPAGTTSTSATVIGPWSPKPTFMSASVYWKPHHHW